MRRRCLLLAVLAIAFHISMILWVFHRTPTPWTDHDGQFVYQLAADPFVLDPHSMSLDQPAYRALRIGMPLAASLVPLPTPWAMAIVVIASAGLGTFAMAHLAINRGVSANWGLLFAVLPVSVYSTRLLLPSVMASALLLSSLLMLERDRWILATVLATCAALTREFLLLPIIGTAIWLFINGKTRLARWYAAVPLSAVGVWAISLFVRFGTDGYSSTVGAPLEGWRDVLAFIFSDHHRSSMGLASLGILVATLVIWFRMENSPLWAAAAALTFFVPFAPFVTLSLPSNSLRVLSPLLSIAVLMAAREMPNASEVAPGGPSSMHHA